MQKIHQIAVCIAIAIILVVGVNTQSPLDGVAFVNLYPLTSKLFQGYGVPFIQTIVSTSAYVHYEIHTIYSDKDIGILLDTNKYRRPAKERTERNKNKAIMQATFRVFADSGKMGYDEFALEFINIFGWDPRNDTTDITDPIGIGNIVANQAIKRANRDGSNKLGDMARHNGDVVFREYNRANFSDYTGYKPINTEYELRDVDRWQPGLISVSNLYYRAQTFKGPHYGDMNTTSGLTAEDMNIPPQIDTFKRRKAAFKKKTDEVLAASAALTDKQKMIAEWFDDKLQGLSMTMATTYLPGGLDSFIKRQLMTNLAVMDAFILMWNAKVQYDAVRPFTTIKYLYGNKKVRAWGGPGKGTVTMYGREWTSYLPTDAFPEYPSGTTCLCAVVGRAIEKFMNGKPWSMSQTFKKGSSLIEPGITPSSDITVTWNSAQEWVNDCAQSRLWAGVHFQNSINTAREKCPIIFDKVYEKIAPLMTST